jgi:hypothetical protein
VTEQDIILDLAGMSGDPLAFVMYSFPWGAPGSELAQANGPEAWQVELLSAIRDGLLTPDQAIQLAISSGHGIGKSAFVSWLILWGISTFEDTRGVVTANTERQLKTKTWAELGKWYRLFIGKFMFDLTATAIYSRDPAHDKTWRIDMIPWSEASIESFAGLHNKGKRIVLIFDEASAISDVIWETSEGALTDSDTQIIWFCAGNPTKNTGRFRECFEGGKFSHRWRTKSIDSRSVSITNKNLIAKWVEDYGEDSDFVRVRVRGVFPRAGSTQFISGEVVRSAAMRPDEPDRSGAPLIMGVDVARFGDDETVISFRRGRDARSLPWIVLRGEDTMAVAARVAALHIEHDCDAIFIDGGGVGGGVIDRCRQLQVPVWEVQFGGKPDRPDPDNETFKFRNKRSEMWGFMKSWLNTGLIPTEQELQDQLSAPEYSYNDKDQIQLEKKSDMKKRGMPSPDRADALALTFAYPVYEAKSKRNSRKAAVCEMEYDPFAKEVA